MCLVTVRFSKSFRKVFNLLRFILFSFFSLNCFFIFVFLHFTGNSYLFTAPDFFFLAAGNLYVCFFLVSIYFALAAALSAHAMCLQFNFWQFYMFPFIQHRNLFILSNASNGVSWCTRFVLHFENQARKIAIDSNAKKKEFIDCFVNVYVQLLRTL